MTAINFNPLSSVIIVQTTISHLNRVVDASLIFDTGATYTMIAWDIADALGIHTDESQKTIPFSTASGLVEAPLMKAGKVQVKQSAVKNLDLIIHSLPEGARVDGLLGLNFIRHFNVSIDFYKGLLRFK